MWFHVDSQDLNSSDPQASIVSVIFTKPFLLFYCQFLPSILLTEDDTSPSQGPRSVPKHRASQTFRTKQPQRRTLKGVLTDGEWSQKGRARESSRKKGQVGKWLGEFVTTASEMSSFLPETLGCCVHTNLCIQCAGNPRYSDWWLWCYFLSLVHRDTAGPPYPCREVTSTLK